MVDPPRCQGSPGGRCHSLGLVRAMLTSENKFVCGEIMAFTALQEAGSESACRANGKLAQKGKTYEMNDGDIAHWKAGA